MTAAGILIAALDVVALTAGVSLRLSARNLRRAARGA